MNYSIDELKKFMGSEFDETLDIYRTSYSPVETKPTEMVTNLLITDSNYHLFVVKGEESVVAMALLYRFDDLKTCLLDYMAVAKGQQRKGIGRSLLLYLLEFFRQRIDVPVGMLLEIQKEDVEDIAERKDRSDRIRFYNSLGAKNMSGVRYLVPPQAGSEPEETYLMIIPTRRINSIPRESVLRNVQSIYSRVYQYTKGDLLTRVSESVTDPVAIAPVIISRPS